MKAYEKVTTEAFAVTYGIDPPMPGCHPYVGAHYFLRWPKAGRAVQSVALFPTLTDAQVALRKMRRKNKNAKIVPVTVRIEPRRAAAMGRG